MRGDDDDAVEEVEGESVGGVVGGSADARVTPVAGHYDDWGKLVLESAVDEGEALDVEHVDLVNEEDAGYYLGLAFVPMS